MPGFSQPISYIESKSLTRKGHISISCTAYQCHALYSFILSVTSHSNLLSMLFINKITYLIQFISKLDQEQMITISFQLLNKLVKYIHCWIYEYHFLDLIYNQLPSFPFYFIVIYRA